MKSPFFDPDVRESIIDHLSGFLFDRATIAFSDEPMIARHRYPARYPREDNQKRPAMRSVRR